MASFGASCDWLSLPARLGQQLRVGRNARPLREAPARLGQLLRIGRNLLALPPRLGQLLQLQAQGGGRRPMLILCAPSARLGQQLHVGCSARQLREALLLP